MQKIPVVVAGPSGYTALELFRLALRHPGIEVVALFSRKEDAPIGDIHPALRGRVDLRTTILRPEAIPKGAKAAFLCLPHGTAMEAAPMFLNAGLRVIDLSSDYRLKDAAVYEKAYKRPHTDKGNLPRAVYGLPELDAAGAIRKADLLANPGCYPTASVLALAPLFAHDLADPSDVVIDAKSGVSGAGREPTAPTHFPECNESLAPYKVAGAHQHLPEIEQILSLQAKRPASVIFTPHLVPMDRGILASCYARLTKSATRESLEALYRDFYKGAKFVRILAGDALPSTKAVAHTNFCDIAVRVQHGRALVFSAIDNLAKGASGQAVQNFNLMFGLDEGAGLE
ncbi:MAG: N-acetyl-gamma-glutamyl-phosphate reductase [Planctomycetota bacterium]